jgi:hypothetical protein
MGIHVDNNRYHGLGSCIFPGMGFPFLPNETISGSHIDRRVPSDTISQDGKTGTFFSSLTTIWSISLLARW